MACPVDPHRHAPPRWVPDILSSGKVLKWMAGNATERLDITAQYWHLVAEPQNRNSGNFGYLDNEMERFIVKEGTEVYDSLVNAADRKVKMRYAADVAYVLHPRCGSI